MMMAVVPGAFCRLSKAVPILVPAKVVNDGKIPQNTCTYIVSFPFLITFTATIATTTFCTTLMPEAWHLYQHFWPSNAGRGVVERCEVASFGSSSVRGRVQK